MSEIIDHYSAIVPISIDCQGDVFVTLVLKKGGERIEQDNGSFFITQSLWGLPAGGQLENELSIDCAYREYAEETGGILIKKNNCTFAHTENQISTRKGIDIFKKTIFLNVQFGYPVFTGNIVDPDILTCEVYPIQDLPTGRKNITRGVALSPSHWKYMTWVLELNKQAHRRIPDILTAVTRQYPT